MSDVVSDLFPLFDQALHEQDRSVNTIRSYLQAVKDFYTWYETEEGEALYQIAALTPIAIMGYRNALQHERHQTTSTINQRLAALRAWGKWLVEQEFLKENPAERVKLVASSGGTSREGLTASQVNALLRQAQQSRHAARNYAIVQVLLQTGLRVGECTTLTFDAITFGERSGSLVVRAGKGNKSRIVPLNGSARSAIAEMVYTRLGAVEPTVKAMATCWPRSGNPLAGQRLFVSQKKQPLTTSAIGQMITELVQEAGDLVPQETTAHTLRHTFARNYLSQYPGDIAGLATLLGHSSLDTTRLYGNPTNQQLAARVEQMNSNAYE